MLAHLAGQDGHLDEFIVLEAVADDGRLAAIGEGEDREQFGFGAGFEAETERPAEVEDLFDDVALLVDLDRIDADVVAGVVVFGDGGFEGFVNFADAMAQDIGEAQQDRQLNAAVLQLVDERLQVDGLVGAFVGMDRDMALVVDAEVPLAPVLDFVDIKGVLDFPLVD